jgi:hypothetical protein
MGELSNKAGSQPSGCTSDQDVCTCKGECCCHASIVAHVGVTYGVQ